LFFPVFFLGEIKRANDFLGEITMDKTIAIIPGDGIGPEIMAEAVKVLKEIEAIFGHRFIYHYAVIGGAAWDKHGSYFPKETAEICQKADAILFGSVGGPVDRQSSLKWKDCEKNSILAMRNQMGLYCNVRPVRGIDQEVDVVCIRELSEDVYFGSHETRGKIGERVAQDVMLYTEGTIRQIAHFAFQLAMARRKKVTSVDKANVLDSSKLWRAVVGEVSKEYPECEVEHMLVDNCAMQLAKNPSRFDVLLMPNLFGDILSDVASIWGGSLGTLPSASFNREGQGLYEPAGGSAPDIAGKGVANPIGQILSAALMLKHSFGMQAEHDAIVAAVQKAIAAGYRTQDIADSKKACTTASMGDAIVRIIRNKKRKEDNYGNAIRHAFCL
jgi:3-isopropylmalate dehydrogenase